MQAIKIWIVEDDEDWRRGLVSYLNEEPDLQVKLASGDPDQVRGALARTEEAEDSQPPDVVLMDIMLHGMPEGIALAEEVAVAAGARVIMLTSMEEKDLILRSFQAGAIDYQLKTDFEGLPAAIRAAARREAPISPAAAARMREEFKRLKALEREFEVKKLQDLITPAELQLLEMVDRGYSQSQIADRQFISVRTVKNHINHILRKLGVPGSKEAARQARDMGLFKPKEEAGHPPGPRE
ncbi:DNA-binding response regulator, NarL/FixJ family, contains REC and HTH domains [Cohnella sp. OV330]|uniref:response regulator transcription factor n=1 Tax=Cohnella sp. OV330 TaxID=1855288 RepID=UPI0008F168EC|nr:response regulator transcription factor [Cohnella sp. OV330]SFB48394.1 DNA-binding response regulator, NarL/FixJ family, contains REC and HTH domains [Cohnella sp. OV330]